MTKTEPTAAQEREKFRLMLKAKIDRLQARADYHDKIAIERGEAYSHEAFLQRLRMVDLVEVLNFITPKDHGEGK